MGEFGSTVSLVASHHDKPETARQRNHNLPSKSCLWFSLFMIFTIIGSVVIVGAVYIEHIQKHIQHLEDREQVLVEHGRALEEQGKALEELGKALKEQVKALEEQGQTLEEQRKALLERGKILEERVKALEERSPCENCKNPNECSKAIEELLRINSAKIRLRRQYDEESEHIKSSHHGIGTHNIALIYADRDKLVAAGNAVNAGTFHVSNLSNLACSGAKKELMVNYRNGNYWCRERSNSSKLVDTMQLTGGNHTFLYFSKENWMNYHLAKSNYNFDETRKDRIQVLKEGIYIVHASVHFSSISSSKYPGYGVYTKKRDPNKPPRLISKCMIPVSDRNAKEGPGIYPCQVWQLQHLKPDDEVFLDIDGYAWFMIEKETLHLALIRLTGDSFVTG